jgi:hypothetical protein
MRDGNHEAKSDRKRSSPLHRRYNCDIGCIQCGKEGSVSLRSGVSRLCGAPGELINVNLTAKNLGGTSIAHVVVVLEWVSVWTSSNSPPALCYCISVALRDIPNSYFVSFVDAVSTTIRDPTIRYDTIRYHGYYALLTVGASFAPSQAWEGLGT